MTERARPDGLELQQPPQEGQRPSLDGFGWESWSSEERTHEGLEGIDLLALGLVYFASGAVVGIVFQGNLVAALAIYGTMIVGGFVGWMLHALLARRPAHPSGAITGSEEPEMSQMYSIEWRSLVTDDVGWMTIEARTVEEAKSKFQQWYGSVRVIEAIALVTNGRAFAMPWRQ